MSKFSVNQILGPGGRLAEVLPGYENRPQQLKMALAVEKALSRKSILQIEAGTGTGKTWAYLVPALLSGRRVVVSTATKNLQEQIVQKDLPILLSVLPNKIRVTLMKGRSNYLCRYRLDQQKTVPGLDRIVDRGRFDDIAIWAEQTTTGDNAEIAGLPDGSPLWAELSVSADQCLGSSCDFFDSCFITKLRREAAESDLIVVNHHLYFADIAVRDRAYGEILPQHDVVILDEAHEVADAAGNYFGRRISQFRLSELARDVVREMAVHKIQDAELQRGAEAVISTSRALFDRLSDILPDDAGFTSAGIRRVRLPLGESLGVPDEPLLRALAVVADRTVLLEGRSSGMGGLSERAGHLGDEVRFLLNREDSTHVYWCEFRENGASLSASPIDVSSILAEKLFAPGRTVVLTSATLSTSGTMEYMSRRLGVPDADRIILDSPYDYGRQALLYLPKAIPDPYGPAFLDVAAAEIRKILLLTEGRAFLLFSSFRHLDEVFARLKDCIPYLLLRQGDAPKTELLRRFREDVGSVLFGTASFWQGVDVEGEALSCVIVDKLPFAVPTDPLVAARSESLRASGEDPFMAYQVPEAILTLKQGLGRLIRSRSDRGLLVILDRRLTGKFYGKAFLDSLPPCPVTDSLETVKAFFGKPVVEKESGGVTRGTRA